MWEDPIVKETRTQREAYAVRFNHNLEAIFEDIRRRQELGERKYVSRDPKRPDTKQHVA